MNMVTHDYKGKESDSLIFYKETKAVYNNIFILIRF